MIEIYSTGAAPSTWKWFEKMREVMGHRPIANEVDAAMNQIDQQGGCSNFASSNPFARDTVDCVSIYH